MKFYDQLNPVLSLDAPQFKSSQMFDGEQITRELARLKRPHRWDRKGIRAYNDAYIEQYAPFDSSGEFKAAVKRDTFDHRFLMPSFEELTQVYADTDVPMLDQTNVDLSHFAPHQRFWAENGFLLIEGMIDEEVCDEYLALRNTLNLQSRRFPTFTPYVEHDVIRRMFLSAEMRMLINDLIGEDLGLHFNLTPFHSTERGWHQDEYLNPPGTNGRYIAAWIAVDDVPEDSGPFEFIAGSNRLPTVARDKVMPFLKTEYQLGHSDAYDWSIHSSMFVNPAYFFKFVRDAKPVTKFLGKKGDVLLWHSRLIHRGAPPANRQIYRPGIIGHYSPIRTARWFGSDIRRYGNGGFYWHFEPDAA